MSGDVEAAKAAVRCYLESAVDDLRLERLDIGAAKGELAGRLIEKGHSLPSSLRRFVLARLRGNSVPARRGPKKGTAHKGLRDVHIACAVKIARDHGFAEYRRHSKKGDGLSACAIVADVLGEGVLHLAMSERTVESIWNAHKYLENHEKNVPNN